MKAEIHGVIVKMKRNWQKKDFLITIFKATSKKEKIINNTSTF